MQTRTANQAVRVEIKSNGWYVGKAAFAKRMVCTGLAQQQIDAYLLKLLKSGWHVAFDTNSQTLYWGS